MKNTIATLLAIIFSLLSIQAQESFYDFTVQDIDGNDFRLEQLKGKKVLVVNVASKCGLTPQYEDLQELYDTYGGEAFEIIAFPANNFMGQEPGSNEEIKSFCTEKFAVTFSMMSKISVKGKDQHPLYAWLTQKEKNGVTDSKVKWNFQKYAINEQGELVHVFDPSTNPMSEDIIRWIGQ